MCLNCADKISDLPPRVDELLAMLKKDADGDDAKNGSKSWRCKSMSGLLCGPLLDAVTARYDGTKNNRGNTSGNHRSASTEESAAISRGIEAWVERKGALFWVQWKGKAGFWPKDKDSPKAPARPWAPPAIGTKIYPIEGHDDFALVINGTTVRKPYLEYGVDVPADNFLEDIVFSSAKNRFRKEKEEPEPEEGDAPKKKRGKYNKPKLQTWPDLTILDVKGQFQLKGRGSANNGEEIPAANNIVLAFITDKGVSGSRKKK